MTSVYVMWIGMETTVPSTRENATQSVVTAMDQRLVTVITVYSMHIGILLSCVNVMQTGEVLTAKPLPGIAIQNVTKQLAVQV